MIDLYNVDMAAWNASETRRKVQAQTGLPSPSDHHPKFERNAEGEYLDSQRRAGHQADNNSIA